MANSVDSVPSSTTSHATRGERVLITAAVAGTTMFLLSSVALSVLIGKSIARADRVEGVQGSDPVHCLWCTGCGHVSLTSITPQPGWTHGDDERYCPDCSDTRFRTWGYS